MSSPAQPGCEAPDLRAARAQRTREAIQAAALHLAVERGYEATTMEDVAARAGVSRRTVFNYFPTKADLFLRAPHVPEQADVEAFVVGDRDLLDDLARLIARANLSAVTQAEDFRMLREILHANPSLFPELHARERLVHSVIRAAIARRLDTDLWDPRVVVASSVAAAMTKAAVELWAGDALSCSEPGSASPARHCPETVREAIDVVTAAMRELLRPAPAGPRK